MSSVGNYSCRYTDLIEPTVATTSSHLLETANRTSKNPFSFFKASTKTSLLVTTQPLNSSLPALPKPTTLSTANIFGATGAAVTGVLAVSYWAWKKIRKNSTVTVPEKAANAQMEVKTPKSIF
jgi:hypothetical protein